jgi:hypothetical protein
LFQPVDAVEKDNGISTVDSGADEFLFWPSFRVVSAWRSTDGVLAPLSQQVLRSCEGDWQRFPESRTTLRDGEETCEGS